MSDDRDVRPLRLPFDVELSLPGAKASAHRALILAALGRGRVVIENATPGDDVRATVAGLRALGFAIDDARLSTGTVVVDGGLPTRGGEATIACGASGASLRFLLALACLVPGRWTLDGSARLLERPLAGLIAALRELGAVIEREQANGPLRVHGGTLRGGRARVDAGASSQHASALLLIGSPLSGGLDLELTAPPSSPAYLRLTLDALARAGVVAHERGARILVAPGAPQPPPTWRIEADWSSAGAFLVLARLASSRFRGRDLDPASAQADAALPRLIAAIDAAPADETVTIDAREAPDQVMNLAVLACHRRSGMTRFVNTAFLAGKECDRPAVLVRELAAAGLDVTLAEDGDAIVVRGGGRPIGRRFDPDGDHRMAMAFSILGSLTPGVSIGDADCIAKSHASFWDDLAACHRSPRPIALIGMPAAGKSALAPVLAAALELEAVDLDAELEREHGPIAEIVRHEGWPFFRRHEAAMLREALRPGRVVACGGGAIEDSGSRRLLKEQALTIFLDEDEAELVRRLGRAGAARPLFAGGDLAGEVAALHARRREKYREAASIVLGPGSSIEGRVASVMTELRRACSW